MLTPDILAAIESAAARAAAEAPAPDPRELRRHLDVLAPLAAAARRSAEAVS